MEKTRLGRARGLAVAGGLAALLLAACGKSAPSGTGGAYGGGGATSPAGSQQTGSVGSATISGVGTVLVNASGRTLYHLTTETNGKINCTGGCASTWPPLIAQGGQAPSAGSGVTGKLGTVVRPDGTTQVTYNGAPLYTYSGDSGPGQATGQGIQNVWYAVMAKGSPGPNPSPTSSGTHSGGYGY